MPRAKIAITIDEVLLERLDKLVGKNQLPNRSKAIEAALFEKLARLDRTRLARECDKLDRSEEASLADEGLELDASLWPEY